MLALCKSFLILKAGIDSLLEEIGQQSILDDSILNSPVQFCVFICISHAPSPFPQRPQIFEVRTHGLFIR